MSKHVQEKKTEIYLNSHILRVDDSEGKNIAFAKVFTFLWLLNCDGNLISDEAKLSIKTFSFCFVFSSFLSPPALSSTDTDTLFPSSPLQA